METCEDRRISITLQFGSHKEVIVLERTDSPQVLYLTFCLGTLPVVGTGKVIKQKRPESPA